MAGIMHKIEDTLNTGGKKDERKGETQGGYNQQDHRGGAQGERKEGFVGQMKDKIPGGGGGGGGGVHQSETQGGYNQQDHRGGAQGRTRSRAVAVAVACTRVAVSVACARATHKVGTTNKSTGAAHKVSVGLGTRSRTSCRAVAVGCARARRKVGTINKSTGATHKVSARKGLLTRSRARSRGLAVAVASVVKVERKRSRTRRRMMVAIAAATATKYLALLPCIRCGGGRGPVYQCCMLLSLEKKRKKLYFSIFCIFALSGVAKQGRM
nr:uncharacterized protein LOC118036497 [Populus alba]